MTVLCLVFTIRLQAQQQVFGQLLSSATGAPVAGASLQLRHQQKHAYSDRQGRFAFYNLKACKDTLVIHSLGFQTKKQKLSLNNTQDSLHLHLSLLDSITPLKTVTVHTDLLQDQNSVYVAKMPLQNLENPQVYNVITQRLVQQQQITKIDEVMRNVAGTISQNTAGGYFSIMSRGFTTYINARNGSSVSSYFTSYDPFNLERIEVLKGPSGTLYQAAASFGGVVNIVTKKPKKKPATTLSFTTGSWGLNRATVDFNHPLDTANRLLFRLNTVLDREKTFQDFGHSNTYSLSPTFLIQAANRWHILAEFELYNSEKTPTPWQSFGDFYPNVRDVGVYERAFSADDMKTKLIRQNGTITSDYQLGSHWKMTTILAALNCSVDHNYFSYNYYLSQDSIRRYIYDYDYNYSSQNIQQNFNGDFQLLGLKNKLVAGLEYVSTKFNYAGYGTNYDTTSIHTFKAMQQKNVAKAIEQRPDFNGAATWTQRRYAVYASDVLYLRPSLMTMLSLRMDKFDYKSDAPYQQVAFSPKLGIVYQPIADVLSVFANYTDGFNNQNTATKKDGTVISLDPIHATQYEAGIKWVGTMHKFSGTLSLYNIRIHNANLYDKDGFFVSQAGIQQSKGFEFQLKSSPMDQLNIIAGYGYNNNQYIKSSSYQGNFAANAPKHIANAWVNYQFPYKKQDYFSIGMGSNYVSQAYTDVYNRTVIPSYLLLNAVVSYHFGSTRLGIKLNNITNQKYYSGAGNPMPPTNYSASIQCAF